MAAKRSRLFHTFTFRFGLVYVGLFSLSVILLFGFIYSFAMRYLDYQVSDAIRVQYSYLLNEYRNNGSEGVEARINKLIDEDEEATRIFLLVNGDYEKIAGNLNEWPIGAQQEGTFEENGKWVRFYLETVRDIPEGIAVKALMIPLSKWRSILIGQSLHNNKRIEQLIIQTFWASLIVTLIMASIGALIMTRSVMKRLGIINHSVQTIMRGNMSARIPYTSGGDEFDDLSSNLNRMLDRIETLMQSLSQFSSNIAHDLRSPLNRIINRLDEGMRTIKPENPARPLLESNIREMEELIGTFNSILKISELEARPDVVQLERCDLAQIISKLTEFYEPYAAEKNISLSNNVSDSVMVSGEKNLLTQAFANLIDNAIKFTPNGGAITIDCENSEAKLEVVIADSGHGIDEKYRDKVFEKFVRLEQSRGSKGNGLGLSMVAATLRIHHATIMLEDNNPGLKVRIRFR